MGINKKCKSIVATMDTEKTGKPFKRIPVTQFIIRELRAHTNTNTHKQTYIYVVRIQEVLPHVAIRSAPSFLSSLEN